MRALTLLVAGIFGTAGILRGQDLPDRGEDLYVALITHIDAEHGATFLLEADRLPSLGDDDGPAGTEMLGSIAGRLAERNVRVVVCEAPCSVEPGQFELLELHWKESGEAEVLYGASMGRGGYFENRVLYRMARGAQGWYVVGETPVWHGDYIDVDFLTVPDSLRQGPTGDP